MKKVITEDGEEYYFDFSRGSLSCLVLDLYVSDNVKVRKNRIIGKSWFGRDRKETYEGIEIKYKKVEEYEFSCSWDNSVDDLSLETIKDKINICIAKYKKSNKNKIELDNWDGYMGNEDARKKEIMRDQKIKDLLNGDTSKLEDFLSKE